MNSDKITDPGGKRRASASKLWFIVLLLAVITLVSWSLDRNAKVSEPESKLVCVPVRRGSIEHGAEASGVVIRDEILYVSPMAGILRQLASEGDRVRAGTVVVQIAVADTEARARNNTQFDLPVERSGVVSFVLDGLERTLTPSSWVDYSAKKVSQLNSEPYSVPRGAHVDMGQALFRVIDNYRMFVLLFPEPGITAEVRESLSEGRGCHVRFDSVSGAPCPARIVSRASLARDDSGMDALLLELPSFPHDLYYLRHVRGKIITKTHNGLIVPKKAIVKGKNGYLVYTPANLGVDSNSISIITSNDNEAICEGLKEGQRVVVNPEIIHEANITVWR